MADEIFSIDKYTVKTVEENNNPPYKETTTSSEFENGGPDIEDIEGTLGPGTVYLYKSRDNLAIDPDAAQDRLPRFARMVFGSVVGLTLVFVVLTILPVAMIVLGVYYQNDCPYLPAVPTILIVTGALTAATNVVNILDQTCNCWLLPPTGSRGKHLVMLVVNLILNGLVLSSFLSLSAWIYGSPYPSDNPSSDEFCEPVVYIFSLCLINFVWLFAGIIGFLAFTFCCCLTFM